MHTANPSTRRKLFFLFFLVVGIFVYFNRSEPSDPASPTKQISRYGTSPPVTPTEPPLEPYLSDARPTNYPTTTGAPSQPATQQATEAPTAAPTPDPPTDAPTEAPFFCESTHYLNSTGSVNYVNAIGWPFRWGNWLSPYWHNRAIAYFGHYDFIWPDENFTFKLEGDDWMQYLPNIVPRNRSNLTDAELEKLKTICGTCSVRKNSLVNSFPHEECEAVYYFTDVIRAETRAAIEKYAKSKNLTIPYTRPGEVVYYDRCHMESFFGHANHGPTGFKIFENIPKNTTKLYWIFNMEDTLNEEICIEYRAQLKKFLSERYPKMEFIYAGNTTFHDFSMIVYAKFVILDTGTFGLMSALACDGEVYMPPFRGLIKSPGLPPNMHWFGEVLIPTLAKKLGIWKETLPALWEWLRSN